MSMKFNQILQEKLGSENLTEIARELDMPKSILHDWVVSMKQPSGKNIPHVKAIAEYLGLTLDELFFGEANKTTISSVSFEDNGRKYRINIERLK